MNLQLWTFAEADDAESDSWFRTKRNVHNPALSLQFRETEPRKLNVQTLSKRRFQLGKSLRQKGEHWQGNLIVAVERLLKLGAVMQKAASCGAQSQRRPQRRGNPRKFCFLFGRGDGAAGRRRIELNSA